MTDEELDEMARDLCHTGELSMPYRCEISDAITTMRAQIADQKRFKDRIIAEASDALEAIGKRCDAANARADRAEAEKAAQIEADAGIADRAADADHKYMLKYPDEANRYDFSRHRAECIASAIRAQPHDRSALDRMLAEAREKALRDAASLPHRHEKLGGQTYAYVRVEEILAMIDKENQK